MVGYKINQYFWSEKNVAGRVRQKSRNALKLYSKFDRGDLKPVAIDKSRLIYVVASASLTYIIEIRTHEVAF